MKGKLKSKVNSSVQVKTSNKENSFWGSDQ
jgi:hypothetical protein